jgi:hypothetical protein
MSNSILVSLRVPSATKYIVLHLVAGFHDFWPLFAIMFSHIFKQNSKRHVLTSFYFRHYKVNRPLYEDLAIPPYNQIKENNGQTC